MTVYKALENITFNVNLLSITTSTTDELTDTINYTYSDGDRMINKLAIFMSYHARHIQLQHPQIVKDFPEHFI